jgi:hypothetical protein
VPPSPEDEALPQRYLSAGQLGEILGMSPRDVRQGLARDSPVIPKPDVAIQTAGGVVYGWDPDRGDLMPVAPDEPSLLGRHPERLPGDVLTGPKMWAALAGVKVETVYGYSSAAARRRTEGRPEPGDMPPPDVTTGGHPRWFMATYRAWEEARPSNTGKRSTEEE